MFPAGSKMFQSPRSGHTGSDEPAEGLKILKVESFNPLDRGIPILTSYIVNQKQLDEMFQSPRSGHSDSDWSLESLFLAGERGFNPLDRGIPILTGRRARLRVF